MKTLDEVVTVMDHVEFCCTNCKLQFDCDEVECFLKDALHYLKEYKANREDPAGDHQQLEKARNLLWEFYQNEPLSWEELKTMEGKSVFVEERYRNGDLKSSGWWLIDFWNDDQICLRDQGGNPWNAHRESIGRDWQAYRKERTDEKP